MTTLFKNKSLPTGPTFRAFLESLDITKENLSATIDTSFWKEKLRLNNDQARRLARIYDFLLLTDSNSKLNSRGKELSRSADSGRRDLLRALLPQAYSRLTQNNAVSLDTASREQLHKVFNDVYGISLESQKKAITFMVQARIYAGLPVAQNIIDSLPSNLQELTNSYDEAISSNKTTKGSVQYEVELRKVTPGRNSVILYENKFEAWPDEIKEFLRREFGV